MLEFKDIIMKLYSIAVSGLLLAVTTSFLISQNDTTNEQYIVFAKSSTQAIELVNKSGAKVEEKLAFVNGVVAHLTDQQLAELQAKPELRISKNAAVTITSKSDTAESASLSLNATLAEQTHAAALHNQGITGQNVTVAILGIVSSASSLEMALTVKDRGTNHGGKTCRKRRRVGKCFST